MKNIESRPKLRKPTSEELKAMATRKNTVKMSGHLFYIGDKSTNNLIEYSILFS